MCCASNAIDPCAQPGKCRDVQLDLPVCALICYLHPSSPRALLHVLQEAGLDPELADVLVNTRRCYLPLDSPEFICSDCSQLALDFLPTSWPGASNEVIPSRSNLSAAP